MSLALQIIIGVVFIAALALILFEKYDRTFISLVAALIVVLIISFSNKSDGYEFYSFIEWEVFAIIIGMELFAEVLNSRGYIEYISLKIVKMTKGSPIKLLIYMSILAFFITAFLDDLLSIILVGSLTIVLTQKLDLNPTPYIFCQAFIIGVGNLIFPISSIQNIIVRNAIDIDFIEFVKDMTFLGFTFLAFTILYFLLTNRKTFFKKVDEEKKQVIEVIVPEAPLKNKNDKWVCTFLLILLITLFVLSSFIGVGVDVISIGIGVLAVLIYVREPKEIWEKVSWTTIFFFIGLFIIVGSLTYIGALQFVENIVISLLDQPLLLIIIILLIGSILSAFMEPVLTALILTNTLLAVTAEIGSQLNEAFWYGIVVSTNLAVGLAPVGSLTLLTAFNLLRKSGQKVTPLGYLKYISPLYIGLIIFSILYFIVYFRIF